MKKFCILASLLIVCTMRANQSQAYVLYPNGNAPVRWNLAANSSIVQSGRVTYNLNPSGSDNVAFAEVEKALTASFQTWEDLPDSTIAFTRGANSSSRGTQNDGLFQVYWAESATDSEYANISGALAVTFLTFRTTGDLLDTAIVFNGVNNEWATNGQADRFDIAEVATHEIGHSIGLSHSAVGTATMFPRTGAGVTRGRTLASDDALGAAALYPVSDLSARTGILRGTVKDNSGAAIFGANVVASDGNGNVIASTLSQTDGSYRISGLPANTYTVFAEPVDENNSTAFYGKGDLTSFYANGVTNFVTTNDLPVAIRTNAETILDITVTRGTAALNPYLVYLAGSQGNLVNTGTAATAGTSTTVGLAGPGLPSSGSPLTISGNGITINRTRFGTYSGGQVIAADITIAANATPGSRTLFVNIGSQRAAITGALEIIGSGITSPPTLSVVSSANYQTSVAQESICSVFGTNLAGATAIGRTNPLPIELNGVKVTVQDSAGSVRQAPLFFVSPLQINYQIPPNTLAGNIVVNCFNNGAQTGRSSFTLNRIAPGIFTANGSGRGPAAGQVLRIKANGQQSYELLATAQGLTVPIDWTNSSDRLFLVLYGTGIRFRNALNQVVVSVGGKPQTVLFAGAQGTLTGLDQMNVQLNRADVLGRGELDVVTTIEGLSANTVRANFK